MPAPAAVIELVDLHKKLAAAKSPDEKTRLEREIKSTDAEIDPPSRRRRPPLRRGRARLVYELYGLTEEEIKIVEGSY